MQDIRTRILTRATEEFYLLGSGHGPDHWERVRQNGLCIARTNDADLLVVELFAWLHDCMRQDDYGDPQHGLRAAEFVGDLAEEGALSEMTSSQISLLAQAIRYHNDGKTTDNNTIGTCWDADRLDLPRVCIDPDPKLMSTAAGKSLAELRKGYYGSDT